MTTNRRNQIVSKAIDTARSVHLSASAGSGKTRALKDRYLTLLNDLERNRLHMDQAVAITFTDKAAAEIKERVMRDLPEDMLKNVIRGRQDLRISTIHSFCMNLLKRYPLEAGLLPDFGILDARDKPHKIQQAIEDTLEYSGRDPAIMDPLKEYTADELIETMEFLLSIRSRLKRMEIDAGGQEDLLRTVVAGMGTKEANAEMRTLITSAEWRAALKQMEQILRDQGEQYEACRGSEHLVLAERKDRDAARALAEVLFPVYFTSEGAPRKTAFIAKKAFAGGNREAYELAYAGIQDMLARFRGLYARHGAGREAVSLLTLYAGAEERYQASKLREGLLDFDDLEIYAYRLLQGQESPDILYWLDRKILHFLVDEFQDTSDIQWAILDRLTEEIFAGQGTDKRMPPTLFVVGDEKQSIYRFREANYRLLESVRVKMEQNIPPGSREILALDLNFRSSPAIIETVNQVFTALWGAAYTPSGSDRIGQRGSARLVELMPASAGESPSGPTEAEVLAREMKALIHGGTTIYERVSDRQDTAFPRHGPGASRESGLRGNDVAHVSGWRERRAGFGDCAVLIQSRTRLKQYEAALQREGIPYRVVGGIGFFEEDEIQAIVNVLFYLWNRDDRLALAAALTSPLFGFTDAHIFQLMHHHGDLAESLRQHPSGAGALLDRWKRYANTEPLAGLIHRIIGDTGAYIRFGRRNPQAVFNLDKLLDTALEFDGRGYTTLQDFAQWVRNVRQAEQREATADMNLPGFHGSVSIMTVHKAKGLEFPVVFLPGIDQQPRSLAAGPLVIVEDDQDGIRLAAKDGESPVYRDMWAREHDELLREHQRLLYVAMTRARDHLVMIGTLTSGKTPFKRHAWLGKLHQAIPLNRQAPDASPCLITSAWPDWTAQISERKEPDARRGPLQEAPEIIEVDGAQVLENIAPVVPMKSLEWKKATDFLEEYKAAPSGEQAEEQAILSPLLRGTILHRCLEEFTRTGSFAMAQIIDEHAESASFSGRRREALMADMSRVLQSILDNVNFSWILERRPGSYSELPFLYRRDHTLISGVIDRVIVADGVASVVDYKAIASEGEKDLAAWNDYYRPQIRIYCEAVKEIFRVTAVEGYLLYLDSQKLEKVVT